MNTTDPPKTVPSMPNEDSGQISPYNDTKPTAIQNVVSVPNPSPPGAGGFTPNPAD